MGTKFKFYVFHTLKIKINYPNMAWCPVSKGLIGKQHASLSRNELESKKEIKRRMAKACQRN